TCLKTNAGNERDLRNMAGGTEMEATALNERGYHALIQYIRLRMDLTLHMDPSTLPSRVCRKISSKNDNKIASAHKHQLFVWSFLCATVPRPQRVAHAPLQ
ncbi:hypothetical protein Tcan_00651, partial [Toxocara canis]